MAFLRHYSSDELSRSFHSAADKLGIEDFRAEQIDSLIAFMHGQVVRGTQTLSTPLGRAMLRGRDNGHRVQRAIVGKMYL